MSKQKQYEWNEEVEIEQEEELKQDVKMSYKERTELMSDTYSGWNGE